MKKSKALRTLLVILTIFISFIMFQDKALAKVRMSKFMAWGCYKYNGTALVYKALDGGNKIIDKVMDQAVFGLYDENSGKTLHAYCIQPGVSINSGDKDMYNYGDIMGAGEYKGTSTPGFGYGTWYKDTNELSKRKQMILQVLNYAYEITDIPSGTFPSNFRGRVKKMNREEYQKILAAQSIIWEIVWGERTNFNYVENQSDDWGYRPDNIVTDGLFHTFYKHSKQPSNPNENFYNVAITQYKHIINKVYNTYYRMPGSNYAFKTTKESANKYEIKVNNSVDIKDSSGAFQYFDVKSNTDGLNAVIVSNDTIRVTATKAFTQDNPAVLELVSKSSKKNGPTAIITNFYVSKNSQDFAYGSPTARHIYIKFYTPKYKLEIIKLDEDKKGLAGAKFNLCSDNKCNDIIAELKSGEDGKVTYEVEKTGTYYVKEIEAPEGYVLDSKIRSITVSDSNSNPKPIEFENKARSMNLTKRTVDENGNVTILEDGCGTDTYTGPKFEIKNKDGKTLYFEEIEEGLYKPSDEENGKIEIKTCNGAFSVKYMTECEYEIVEREAPEGLMLPDNPALKVNICKSDGNISFTNGFTGLEFQKKDESGNLISGGKFALQKKENGAYKDVLLKRVKEGYYTYDSKLTEDDADVSYIMETDGGISFIDKISTGEYRVVEKEAPEGYEPIKDKDSTAKIVIKDDSSNSYNRVELINKKISVGGDDASAELIVTITTGRKVLNYVLIFGGLASILIVLIILRKKFKK